MKKIIALVWLGLLTSASLAKNLPSGFVYLSDIDKSIAQEMRYFTSHNFLGRKVKGYLSSKCILTLEAAKALSVVQKQALDKGLSLKVYDCYRPQKAVSDFMSWVKQPKDREMKKEFYPLLNKKNLFKRGYIATRSGHSRGSTIDVTLIPITNTTPEKFHFRTPLRACFLAHTLRFFDGSIDMGTSWDCFDKRSHTASMDISVLAQQNRSFLKELMLGGGFKNYDKEWWHYTMNNEPFKDTYFDFNVQ